MNIWQLFFTVRDIFINCVVVFTYAHMQNQLRNLKKIQLRPLSLNTISLKAFRLYAKEGLLQIASEPFSEGKYQDFFRQIPKIS